MKPDILLIGFNRPALVESQLERLANAKWSRLFISIDGPRAGRSDDRDNVDMIRRMVEDWRGRLPGEVLAKFWDENVGSRYGVSNSITWAFKRSDELIILEDDCAPEPDFFVFASAMLERYRNNFDIMSIAGFNPIPTKLMRDKEGDYFFTQLAQIWGWATWRNRWKWYGPTRDADNIDELVQMAFKRRGEIDRWQAVFGGRYPKALTWDSYWRLASYLQDGLCIVPRANLIKNVGMGPDAARTVHEDPALLVPTSRLPSPFREPGSVKADPKIENWYWETRLSMTFWARFRRLYRTRLLSRLMKWGRQK